MLRKYGCRYYFVVVVEELFEMEEKVLRIKRISDVNDDNCWKKIGEHANTYNEQSKQRTIDAFSFFKGMEGPQAQRIAAKYGNDILFERKLFRGPKYGKDLDERHITMLKCRDDDGGGKFQLSFMIKCFFELVENHPNKMDIISSNKFDIYWARRLCGRMNLLLCNGNKMFSVTTTGSEDVNFKSRSKPCMDKSVLAIQMLANVRKDLQPQLSSVPIVPRKDPLLQLPTENEESSTESDRETKQYYLEGTQNIGSVLAAVDWTLYHAHISPQILAIDEKFKKFSYKVLHLWDFRFVKEAKNRKNVRTKKQCYGVKRQPSVEDKDVNNMLLLDALHKRYDSSYFLFLVPGKGSCAFESVCAGAYHQGWMDPEEMSPVQLRTKTGQAMTAGAYEIMFGEVVLVWFYLRVPSQRKKALNELYPDFHIDERDHPHHKAVLALYYQHCTTMTNNTKFWADETTFLFIAKVLNITLEVKAFTNTWRGDENWECFHGSESPQHKVAILSSENVHFIGVGKFVF